MRSSLVFSIFHSLLLCALLLIPCLSVTFDKKMSDAIRNINYVVKGSDAISDQVRTFKDRSHVSNVRSVSSYSLTACLPAYMHACVWPCVRSTAAPIRFKRKCTLMHLSSLFPPLSAIFLPPSVHPHPHRTGLKSPPFSPSYAP